VRRWRRLAGKVLGRRSGGRRIGGRPGGASRYVALASRRRTQLRIWRNPLAGPPWRADDGREFLCDTLSVVAAIGALAAVGFWYLLGKAIRGPVRDVLSSRSHLSG
jgi:hypothetical protein